MPPQDELNAQRSMNDAMREHARLARDVAQAHTQIAAETEKTQKTLASMSFGPVGAAVGALASGVGFLVKQFIEADKHIKTYNRTIATVEAQFKGFTGVIRDGQQELSRVRTNFFELATTLGVTGEEVASLYQQTSELVGIFGGEGTESVRKVWGLAKAAGTDFDSTVRTLSVGMLDLGISAEESRLGIFSLATNIRDSGVSVRTLLPTIDDMSRGFVHIGLSTERAGAGIAELARRYREIGVGPRAIAQMVTTGATNLANANLGLKAFFGQQLGLGGGLGAAERFEQKLGKDPINTLIDVSQDLAAKFGGNTIAQRIVLSQMLGVSQNQAKTLLKLLDGINEGTATREDLAKKMGIETDKAISGARKYLTTIATHYTNQIQRVHEYVIRGIEKFVEKVFGVTDAFGEAGEQLKGFFDSTIIPFFKGPFQEFIEETGEVVRKIYEAMRSTYEAGEGFWSTIKEGFKTFWEESGIEDFWNNQVIPLFKNAANIFVDTLLDKLGDRIPFMEGGKDKAEKAKIEKARQQEKEEIAEYMKEHNLSGRSGLLRARAARYRSRRMQEEKDDRQVLNAGLVSLSEDDLVIDKKSLGAALSGEKGSAIPELIRATGRGGALPPTEVIVTVKVTGDMLSDSAIRDIGRRVVASGIAASGKPSLDIARYEGH